jgi:hypothetical protein
LSKAPHPLKFIAKRELEMSATPTSPRQFSFGIDHVEQLQKVQGEPLTIRRVEHEIFLQLSLARKHEQDPAQMHAWIAQALVNVQTAFILISSDSQMSSVTKTDTIGRLGLTLDQIKTFARQKSIALDAVLDPDSLCKRVLSLQPPEAAPEFKIGKLFKNVFFGIGAALGIIVGYCAAVYLNRIFTKKVI